MTQLAGEARSTNGRFAFIMFSSKPEKMQVFGIIQSMASIWNVLSAVSPHGKRVFLNLNPTIVFFFKKMVMTYEKKKL